MQLKETWSRIQKKRFSYQNAMHEERCKINTITKKLSTTEKTAVDKVIGTSSTKNIVSVNTKEILYKKSIPPSFGKSTLPGF